MKTITPSRAFFFFGFIFSIPFFSIRSQAQDSTLIRIQSVENGLIPISSTRADSGAPQTILQRMQTWAVPGVSIAVFDSGRIIWAKGYGLKDKAQDLPVDTATLFQAASISKPVTSTAVMRLVEMNKIALNVDVNLQLRSWKVPENEFTVKEKVTPARIISHMAGLSVHGFRGYRQDEKIPTLLQILDGLPPANSPPVRVIAVPGTTEIYSGGGFVLLQQLIRDVTGQPFDAVMKELVLQPAGMTQSAFTLDLPPAMASLVASGYHQNGEMVEGGHYLYPEQAPAGLWTTPSDLARFMLAIGDAYRGGNGIIQQETARKMLTRVPNGGGMGFGLDGVGDTYRFRHNGQNAGFSCYAVSFAGIGRGVVIMTNTDQGAQFTHELVRAIARAYHWPAMWNKD